MHNFCDAPLLAFFYLQILICRIFAVLVNNYKTDKQNVLWIDPEQLLVYKTIYFRETGLFSRHGPIIFNIYEMIDVSGGIVFSCFS